MGFNSVKPQQSIMLATLMVLAVGWVASSLAREQQPVSGQPSVFAHTVTQLDSGASDNSALFASIALSQLAEAYYLEADVIHDAGSRASAKQQRWARSVMAYAQEITQLNDQVINGAVTRVLLYPHAQVVVKVTDRLITLSHPRMDQQVAYEQAVLSHFCELVSCSDRADTGEQWPSSAGLPRAAESLDWRFTEDGAECAQGGLTISFHHGTDFKTLRNHCRELFQELDDLLQALYQQQQHGMVIDWHRVSINASYQHDGHIVLFNRLGDRVTVRLPHLYRSKQLFRELTPWLQARLEGVDVIYEVRIQ